MQIRMVFIILIFVVTASAASKIKVACVGNSNFDFRQKLDTIQYV
jgi:hypothetical protein